MQPQSIINAITPNEFNELLDEEFDNVYDIRSPFKRKPSRDRLPLLCDGMSWDEEFELAAALGE